MNNPKLNIVSSIENDLPKDKVFLCWQSNNKKITEYTFADFVKLSNQFGNLLLREGLKKGDRIFFFLPRIPVLYYGFLGALKIGAIAGNFFPAFAENALFDRLNNSEAKIIVTNKELSLRLNKIKNRLKSLNKILIIEDLEKMLGEYSSAPLEINTYEDDPAYMMYTSSTGNTPVCGIVTSHKAVFQQTFTAKLVLDLKPEDIYWCTADPGWVTGTVYGIIAPWNLGITVFVSEARFNPEEWLRILEKQNISVWYTSPTALRMVGAAGINISKYKFLKLRHICTVGEALPPATIKWCQNNFGLTVYDTWWQTETGAIMIANLKNKKIKPGSMGLPVENVKAAILDENYLESKNNQEGNLAFKKGWPSMMINVWGNPKHYQRYFHNDWYISGDRAKKDSDGYYWFIGRADDVIKTSGERIGPFEVESCLMECEEVVEAGVIGKPDEIRGQIIKAFIVLKKGVIPNSALVTKFQDYVKSNLAGHAYPREIEFVDKLPKNRSGKIVRRILKAKELGLPLGETSTLEEE